MIGTFRLKSVNALQKGYTENLGSVIADDLYSADSATVMAFATTLDSFARGINNLTTNTYKDSTVEIVTSINDVIAEHIQP